MKKKLLFSALIVLVLAFSVMTPALAVVEQSDAYYVADYAGVLSDAIEQKIVSSNADLEQKCDGAQIVVVTVQYLDGMYADEYAATLFNNWGVGDKNANNGMLLLLATGENKAWLSVGAGISGSFSDNKVDDYFNRYFWDEFDKGNYETATSDMLEALFSWYADFYNVDSSQSDNGANGNTVNNAISASDTIMAWFIILSIFFLVVVLPIIVVVVKVSSDKRRYRNYYSNIGMPAPTYHFWYRWGGRPHNAWWYGPDGPGWHSRPRGGYYHNGQNNGYGGFNSSNNPDSGGFGGFSAGSSSGSQGSGHGGGGFAGGGGGRGGSGKTSGGSSGGNHAHQSGSSNGGGFGGFGSGSRGGGSGGFGGFGGGSSSRGGGGRSSGGGGGRR